MKQAFINANRDAISFAEGDISVTNTPNGSNVSTITVNINKGRLTKSFTSNLNNMNFLRWVNFPQDYTVTWTNAKIANRPTDGGLSWSDDHKSLIYRYDATLGTQITTNDILTLLKATTTVPDYVITLLVMKKHKQKLVVDQTIKQLVIHNQIQHLMVNDNLR